MIILRVISDILHHIYKVWSTACLSIPRISVKTNFEYCHFRACYTSLRNFSPMMTLLYYWQPSTFPLTWSSLFTVIATLLGNGQARSGRESGRGGVTFRPSSFLCTAFRSCDWNSFSTNLKIIINKQRFFTLSMGSMGIRTFHSWNVMSSSNTHTTIICTFLADITFQIVLRRWYDPSNTS